MQSLATDFHLHCMCWKLLKMDHNSGNHKQDTIELLYILQTGLRYIIFVITPIGTRKKLHKNFQMYLSPHPQSNVEHDKLLFLHKAYWDQH